MALTKAQRTRLDKLATYLEGLPKNYKHFGMDCWVLGHDEQAIINYAKHNGGVQTCGTAACAAGHGPAAGVLVPARFIGKQVPWHSGVSVDWEGYCSLFIGEDWDAHSWCFGGFWSEIDDHHWGAAARIRYLLDKGAVPEDYRCPEHLWPPLYAAYRIDAKATADA